MFAMSKIMEMTKEEQNQTALYLINNIIPKRNIIIQQMLEMAIKLSRLSQILNL